MGGKIKVVKLIKSKTKNVYVLGVAKTLAGKQKTY